jgi:hypothetical protein
MRGAEKSYGKKTASVTCQVIGHWFGGLAFAFLVAKRRMTSDH